MKSGRLIGAGLAIGLGLAVGLSVASPPAETLHEPEAAACGESPASAAALQPPELRSTAPSLQPESEAALSFHERRDAAYGDALARYHAIAAAGGWPTLPDEVSLQIGDLSPEVARLRQRLQIEGDLAGDVAGNPECFDRAVEEAVKRAQRRYGVRADGIVDQRTGAALNVPVEKRVAQLTRDREEWRGVPATIGGRSVLINIPAFTMEVIEGERVVLESRVIVGRPERPTPRISGELSSLTFAPYWNVPPNIEAEDLIPEVQADPAELERRNIRVLTRGDPARVVDPATIDWTRYPAAPFPYRFRQEPGGTNPMGRVKFQFANSQHILLHDTHEPHMFEFRKRAHSSGCIRVERSLELAGFLLAGAPGWDEERIRGAASGARERWVDVPAPVPIRLIYLTSWMDDTGSVHFHPDIYAP